MRDLVSQLAVRPLACSTNRLPGGDDDANRTPEIGVRRVALPLRFMKKINIIESNIAVAVAVM